MAHHTTTRSAIKALGGVTRLANRLHLTVQRVSNWNVFDRFPPNALHPVTRLLTEIGDTVEPTLFNQLELPPCSTNPSHPPSHPPSRKTTPATAPRA